MRRRGVAASARAGYYDPDNLTKIYYQHYLDQQGGALDVFRGGVHQYGSGLGSILKAIGRFFMPVAMKSAKKFAISAARGLSAGESFKTAAKKALAPAIHEAVSTSVEQVHKRLAKKRKSTQKGKGLSAHSPKRKRRRLTNARARAPTRKRKPKKRVYKGLARVRKVQRRLKKIRYLNTNF